jgi:AhpD family alkylhydroperoxidase
VFSMEPRIDYTKVAPGAMQVMFGFGKYLSRSGLEPALLNLVYLRASQINGCAYCIDMHWKDLRAQGENAVLPRRPAAGPSRKDSLTFRRVL